MNGFSDSENSNFYAGKRLRENQNKLCAMFTNKIRKTKLRIFLIFRKMLKSSLLFNQIRHLSNQKLPARLTEKLLHGNRGRKSFPKAPKSLSLARNLAQANVSLPQFIKQIQPYVAKKTPKKDEILLIEDGEIQDYLVALKNINENQDKYLNLSGGILNFHCHYKIAELFEIHAQNNIEPKIEFQEFPNLIYMQWMTYFLNRKTEFSQIILEQNLEIICDFLIQDLREYAKEYQKTTLTVSIKY